MHGSGTDYTDKFNQVIPLLLVCEGNGIFKVTEVSDP